MDELYQKITEASMRFLSPVTSEQIYGTIVERAVNIFDGKFGSIFLEKAGVLERVYSSSPLLYTLKIQRRGVTYSTFKKKKYDIVSVEKLGAVYLPLKKTGIQSTIFIPFFYEGKPFGILLIHLERTVAFDKNMLSALKLFGTIASLAIKKTHLYEETKQAVELRDFFISSAAHELRTPLTSISGYIQLLHSRLAKNKGVEGRWIRQLMEENTRLVLLTKELLEANRIKTGTANYLWQECRVIDVITRVLNRLEYHYPRHIITIKNNIRGSSDNIIGDFDKLLQVFYNILENAAEFSSDDKPISVSLSDSKTHVNIKIQDKGRGINKENLEKIFDGYLNGSEEHNRKGIGIGLFLAKNILLKHHGTIDVRSQIHKGTVVDIKLPKRSISGIINLSTGI